MAYQWNSLNKEEDEEEEKKKKKKMRRRSKHCHISGDSNIQSHCCENFKFHTHHT